MSITGAGEVYDGCMKHMVATAEVNDRWHRLEAFPDQEAGMCACCFSPCEVGKATCTKCPMTVEELAAWEQGVLV